MRQQEEDLRVIDPNGVKEVFDKHRALGHAGLLKIYLPVFLLNEAKQHSLQFIPPILYQGTKQMIHFAVQCAPYTQLGAGRVLMARERIDEINRPLLVLHDQDDLREVELGKVDLGDSIEE